MAEIEKEKVTRRPTKVRQTRWAAALAQWLIRARLRPNHVSVLSVAFAGLAGASLILAPRGGPVTGAILFTLAGLLIQLRLLCNILDGLMAVEGGLKTRSGEVFNDLPDRVSDAIILVCAGYATSWPHWAPELGAIAGLLAVMTAYVRVLGGSAGASQYFSGPMAKQQRATLITVACAFAAVETGLGWSPRAIAVALMIVAAGSALTVARRSRSIVRELDTKGPERVSPPSAEDSRRPEQEE